MKRISIVILILFIISYFAFFTQSSGPRVLFIGDSITDGGWGGGDAKPSSERNHWDMNHIFGSGYMYLCATYYMANFPEKEYEFFNRGISANTLKDLKDRWEEDIIKEKPDILSVLIGTNDINNYMYSGNNNSFDFKTWENDYRLLLDRALRANPKLKLVLGAPFVSKTGSMRKSKDYEKRDSLIRRCGSIVEKIAKDYNAVYLPYQDMFDQVIKKYPTSKDTYWIWDGIHPTPAGHKKMADLWIQEVDKRQLLN